VNETDRQGENTTELLHEFHSSTQPYLLLLSSNQSRVQEVEMLVGDPGDVYSRIVRDEGHLVRDGYRDLRVRVDGRGGGVLDEIDERGGGDRVCKQEGREAHGEGTKRETHWPCTMKPMIASLERLTSHDTKTPPGMLRIMWLDSQDPIPDTADTGRHLMRMESDDNEGSESEETREELAM
jgi:hypothetical protein